MTGLCLQVVNIHPLLRPIYVFIFMLLFIILKNGSEGDLKFFWTEKDVIVDTKVVKTTFSFAIPTKVFKNTCFYLWKTWRQA